MTQKIETFSPRMSMVRDEDELSIVISAALPSRKVRLSGILFWVWMCSGLMGIVYFFQLTDSTVRTYLLVWLGFWAYFAYVLGRAWMWWRFGSEIIKVKNGRLLLKRDTRGRGFVNDYNLKTLRNFRAGDETKSLGWVERLGGNFWNTDCESVSFEADGKEITLGYQLSAKERDQVLNQLRAYQKKLLR